MLHICGEALDRLRVRLKMCLGYNLTATHFYMHVYVMVLCQYLHASER